jgi:hypothetical protein
LAWDITSGQLKIKWQKVIGHRKCRSERIMKATLTITSLAQVKLHPIEGAPVRNRLTETEITEVVQMAATTATTATILHMIPVTMGTAGIAGIASVS